MRFLKGLGLPEGVEQDHPVLIAADIAKGAVMIMGPTAGTDNDCVILGTGACADVVGITARAWDYSEEGTSVCGSDYKWIPLIVNPLGVLLAEYDQSDTMAATNTAATTALTLTSLEDNIDGAFLYCTSGDAIGELVSLTASASGSCTLKAATGTAIAVGDTFIKILPRNHRLVKLNTAATGIGTDAAAGSGVFRVIENVIETTYSGGMVKLDPGTHSGLSNLDAKNVKFSAQILSLDNYLNPLS